MILPRSFFERDTCTVARALLGQMLVCETPEGIASGIIVETEAYLGTRDDAAHSYRGASERVRVLYDAAGLAYIYLIYGMYHCLNITTGPVGAPECVLIRALEPVSGLELMGERRKTTDVKKLCSGPGKLCMALGISRDLYGADVCAGPQLTVLAGTPPGDVDTSPRIGIDYARETRDKPWRFTAAGSPFVSRRVR